MGSLGKRGLVGCLATLAMCTVAFAGTQAAPKNANTSEQAAALLNRIHEDAYRANDAAGRLENEAREQTIPWQEDAYLLGQVKHWTNAMDRNFSQLRTIQGELPRYQQNEIKVLAPAVIELTDTTQYTLKYLSRHEDRVKFPRFEGYATAIYQESSRAEAATATVGKRVVG